MRLPETSEFMRAISGEPQNLVACPIEGCTWVYTVPRLVMSIEGGTPTRMLRRATRLQHAITEQTQATERALADHFRSHQTAEWLECLQRLRQKIADRDARIAELERSTT